MSNNWPAFGTSVTNDDECPAFPYFSSIFSSLLAAKQQHGTLLQQYALKLPSSKTGVKLCHSNYVRHLINPDTFGLPSSHLKAFKRHSPLSNSFSVFVFRITFIPDGELCLV